MRPNVGGGSGVSSSYNQQSSFHQNQQQMQRDYEQIRAQYSSQPNWQERIKHLTPKTYFEEERDSSDRENRRENLKNILFRDANPKEGL